MHAVKQHAAKFGAPRNTHNFGGGGLLSRSVGSLRLGRAGRKAQHHDQNEQKRK